MPILQVIDYPFIMRHLVLLSFLCAHLVSYAQVTYNLSGHAYLEGEEDHSSLVFSVINPQSLDTLAATSPDSSGLYSIDVSPGFYLLNWSHVGHIPQELGDFAFSTDTVLADVTLLSGYVQDACGEVSGVWPSGSVYDVLCDIEVPVGDTLTIESGTRVRFKEGTNLVCNGVLRVLGDSSDRVVFTSREPSPLPGDWGHVSLYAQGNTISHLDYEYANDGFTGDGASYTTIDNTVMVGSLSLSANGIYLTNSSNLTITNNTISVAGDFGVYSPDSPDSYFENNEISASFNGIYSPNSPNSLLENNDVSGPSNGLHFENSPNLTVTNNVISVGGDYGVYSPYSPGSLLENNDVEAIRCVYSAFSDSIVITHNNLSSDGSFDTYGDWSGGIRNPNSPHSLITNNVILGFNYNSDGGVVGVESHDSEISDNTVTVLGRENNMCTAIYADRSVVRDNTLDVTLNSECSTGEFSPYVILSHGSAETFSLIEGNAIAAHGCAWGMNISNASVIGNAVEFNTGNPAVILGTSSSLLVDNNTIASNGRAIETWGGVDALVITGNTIASNATAINLTNSDVLVSHNLIESQGRGVEISSLSGGEIVNNTIVSPNSADYGIHISNLTAPVVQNNIVEGFTNGIYAENNLQNQFIQNNNLWNISGDLFSGTAMPPLVGEMIDLNLNGDECDIYSNLNLDPLFVNPDSADYTLQLASPCINAGSEGSELDPDGTIADIGALYYPNPPIDTTTVVDPVTYNLSGHAYLEGEEDHSSLVFSVINPQSLDTLAATSPDSSGLYSIDVSPGFYLLNWSHVGHIPQELGDFAFSTDTVLADVTLLSGYVQDACGEVSGVWPSGSVYDVLCDIEVPVGDTLTIESGTRVRFKEGTNLVCNGVLRVLGDSSDRVVFTSREPSPLPGDWGHVSLYAQGNTISHLDYEYANDGFTGDGASYTTIDNTVMVGSLSLSANGIYLTNSSNLTITNNTISVAGDFGVYSPDSPDSYFENNEISASFNGIYSPNSPNSLLENNDVSGPSNGLHFENSPNLTVTNNVISVGGDYGVYSPYSPGSLLENNDVEAIRCVYSAFSDSIVITHNNLSSDGSFDTYGDWSGGIRNPNSPHSLITNNVILGFNYNSDGGVVGVESHDSEISDNTVTVLGRENNMCTAIYADRSVVRDNTLDVTLNSECSTGEFSPYVILSHGSAETFSLIEGNAIAAHGCAWGMNISNASVIGNAVEFNTGNPAVILGTSSSLLVDNNTIASNGRAIETWGGVDALVITGNTIASNATAINLTNSDVLVSHNLIESQGRGVEISSLSGGEIVNNTIVSPNSADYGIHISNLTAPVVQNNIVEGFTNGIYAENNLQNQFIQNNNLWNISGDLFSGTAMPPLVGEMIDLNLNGDECDIYSNLNLDPLFVNPDSADYTLQLASPCINAGSEGSELDPDGTIADIGAFYNPIPYGCTDPAAANYDEDAYLDNGTCLYGGCMSADACNFDPEATIDDESCDFSCLTTGCSDEEAINYDVFADGSDDGGCLFIGCQDETALNYDVSANYPGQCEYLELCPGDFSGDGLVDIVDLLDLFTMWENVCPWIVD